MFDNSIFNNEIKRMNMIWSLCIISKTSKELYELGEIPKEEYVKDLRIINKKLWETLGYRSEYLN